MFPAPSYFCFFSIHHNPIQHAPLLLPILPPLHAPDLADLDRVPAPGLPRPALGVAALAAVIDDGGGQGGDVAPVQGDHVGDVVAVHGHPRVVAALHDGVPVVPLRGGIYYRVVPAQPPEEILFEGFGVGGGVEFRQRGFAFNLGCE